MAYLGNGIYDLLDVIRASKNPQINYEGLYEEPADTSINLDPMYNIGARQFGDMRMGMPQAIDIMQQAPSSNLDLSSLPANMGVANEEDVEQEFLPDQKPSGIAKLFEFLGKLPTPFNLARRGLGSLRGLNDRIQGSDFGQATSLMDYLDMRKYGGLQGRNDAAARNMAQARGITKSLASRPSSTSGGYQRGPGGSGAQSTGASKSQSQAGPGFSGSGSASEMGSF